ncbi:MAG TPA: LacI family DNA-binding transcriptional regulator [Chthoniobacterales bacterium]|nr:LacI family DNA-binding transcriptional regulator [Chthoniobacterales bacterium]
MPQDPSVHPRLSIRDRVTLKSLAQQLGVSAMTVSNAFNRPEELSADLRQHILSTAASAGYHGPRPSGRMLRTGLADAIALFNPDPIPHLFEDTNASAFMAGISEICEKHQYGLTVLPAVQDISRITAIDKVAVDGFILYAIPDHSSIIKRVLGRQLPTVTVDMGKLAAIAAVGIDDRDAARKIADHVLELGHRQIAILSLEMLPDGFSGLVNGDRVKRCRASVTRQRLLGYVDGLNAAGIDPATVPIYEIRINDDAEASYWTNKFLKARRRRPTAIFSMSDRMAFGALHAATRLGLKVPRDLSIIGFDDIPQAAGSTPALTTVRQPSRAKGQVAAAIVTGDLPYTAEFQELATELIVRESVAVPRAQKRS